MLVCQAGQTTADLPGPSMAMNADFSSRTAIKAKQTMGRSLVMKVIFLSQQGRLNIGKFTDGVSDTT